MRLLLLQNWCPPAILLVTCCLVCFCVLCWFQNKLQNFVNTRLGGGDPRKESENPYHLSLNCSSEAHGLSLFSFSYAVCDKHTK